MEIGAFAVIGVGIWLVVWLTLGRLAANDAKRRGHDPTSIFLLVFILGVLGALAYLFIRDPIDEEKQRAFAERRKQHKEKRSFEPLLGYFAGGIVGLVLVAISPSPEIGIILLVICAFSGIFVAENFVTA